MSSSEHIRPGDSLATSRSMLQRARNRESEAWEELVEIYTPLVYFWCRRVVVPEQDIPDLVQDVFRAVIANIASFRKQKPSDTFRGWLRTITRSKISDYYRRQGRSPPACGGTDNRHRLEQIPEADDLGNDMDAAEESAEQSIIFQGLEGIREQFQPKTWEAFWRVVIDQKSVADVAQELGMRPGTVRVAKCRVLQRLRQQLGDVE